MWKRDEQIFRRTNCLIFGCLERRFFADDLSVGTNKSTTVRYKFTSDGQTPDDVSVQMICLSSSVKTANVETKWDHWLCCKWYFMYVEEKMSTEVASWNSICSSLLSQRQKLILSWNWRKMYLDEGGRWGGQYQVFSPKLNLRKLYSFYKLCWYWSVKNKQWKFTHLLTTFVRCTSHRRFLIPGEVHLKLWKQLIKLQSFSTLIINL